MKKFKITDLPAGLTLGVLVLIFTLAHFYTLSLVKQFFSLDVPYRVIINPILIMELIQFLCGAFAGKIIWDWTDKK